MAIETPPTEEQLAQYRQNFFAEQAQRMQDFGALVQANPYIEMSGTAGADERFVFQPNLMNRPLQLVVNGELIGTGTTDAERNALVDQARALSGEGDRTRTVQLLRQVGTPVEQGGIGYFYAPVYDDQPDPAGLGDFLLKTVLPIGLNFIPGLGQALSFGLKGGLGAGVGIGATSALGRTAGGVLSGESLGDALKAGLTTGALSGLTAGALNLTGADAALGGLGGGNGSTLANTLADLGPDAINVIASRLPGALTAGIASGAGGALSNALPSDGGVRSPGQYVPPTEMGGLDVIANAIPPSSALPGLAAGLSGIGQVAIEQALASQPQQPATEEGQIDVIADQLPPLDFGVPPIGIPGLDLSGMTPNVPDLSLPPETLPADPDEIVVEAGPAPSPDLSLPPIGLGGSQPPTSGTPVEEPEIGVEADRVPPSVITTPPLPTPPIDLGGLTQTVPDIQPPVDPDEITVTASPTPSPDLDPGSLLAGLPLLAPLFPVSVPPLAPTGSTAGKALTTAQRVLGALSLLGSLGGVGGRNVPNGMVGTRGSLSPVFSGSLPTSRGIFSPSSFAPRDMSGVDFTRYGYGPAMSFFENVPRTPEEYRAALQAAGVPAMAEGGLTGAHHAAPSDESYAVTGTGTGRSDEIPALLSDGEYVIDAETVALLGDGSNKAGAERLDAFRVNVRKHKGRNLAAGRFSDNAKSPEKYLHGGRA